MNVLTVVVRVNSAMPGLPGIENLIIFSFNPVTTCHYYNLFL